jgi:glucokinase
MRDALEQEALADSLKACEIVPAALGDRIGDYAALALAAGAASKCGGK